MITAADYFDFAISMALAFGLAFELPIVIILGIYLWTTYNGLVTLNVRVDEAWSDITVQLKRRADLLPNLIETVKGYAAHEKGTLEAVMQARNAAVEKKASTAVKLAMRTNTVPV